MATTDEWQYFENADSFSHYWFGHLLTSSLIQGRIVNFGNRCTRTRKEGFANKWGIFETPGNVWEWRNILENYKKKNYPLSQLTMKSLKGRWWRCHSTL